jgi:hypothetical protein
MYRTYGKSIIAGVGHGIVAAAISTPITYFLFNGFTGDGNDIIVAFFHSQ